MMDISHNRGHWPEQVLVVSFRWPRHDFDDLIDDIAAIAPRATIRRQDDEPVVGTPAGDRAGSSLDRIVLELPDDPALLNRTIGTIFHLGGDAQPAIKVSRGLRSRPAGDATGESRRRGFGSFWQGSPPAANAA